MQDIKAPPEGTHSDPVISDQATPMMRQYLEIKSAHKDAFLFFRMGDFYELFFDDAREASRILNITLTSRGSYQENPVPMCGVPCHSAENYIAKMVEARAKVAICEQVEDASAAKGVVRREVVRIITPGTVIDGHLLKEKRNNFLLSLTRQGSLYGIAYADLSTGDFKTTFLNDKLRLVREIERIRPSEIIVPKEYLNELKANVVFENMVSMCAPVPDYYFDFKHAYQLLTGQFKTHALDGFGLDDAIPSVCAAGALLQYVTGQCSFALPLLRTLSYYHLGEFMLLDESTKRNFELNETTSGGGTSLVDVLDDTLTPMGGRLLVQWVNAPLQDMTKIEARLKSVTLLKDHPPVLENLKESLKHIRDIERLIGRVTMGSANPRDVLALNQSLKQIPSLNTLLRPLNAELINALKPCIVEFHDLMTAIDAALQEDAPVSVREGGVIKPGFHKELDEIIDLCMHAKHHLAKMQQEEIEKTGIKTLKVKFNQVFGYYIEISKGQAHAVPAHYTRRQTLVNAERFVTEELKELEAKILAAQQKRIQLEQSLFDELKQNIMNFADEITLTAKSIAVVDVLRSLAVVSLKNQYVEPVVNDSGEICIEEGRHPVVEKLIAAGQFIHNETFLCQPDHQIMLITGPNMAGKSTYLRQVGLITLLAHIGSHVPAKKAVIGLVDRIFTRVGAFDDLSRGKSTFMVEMTEMAAILNQATKKSLLLLDEIGRGTSTFDGMSIAWAVIEYLTFETAVKAKTLFATHYHELTILEGKLPGLQNYNIAVKEWNGDVLFLRKIVKGPADQSYGIHVARLAGLPLDVIKRAKEVLSDLETQGNMNVQYLGNKHSEATSVPASSQLLLFPDRENKQLSLLKELALKIKETDPLNTTPMQALQLINEWHSRTRAILKD